MTTTKRYWLIEQPELDEDDDHKIIHTTDLDVYPGAKILGEFVLKEEQGRTDNCKAVSETDWKAAVLDLVAARKNYQTPEVIVLELDDAIIKHATTIAEAEIV